MRFYTVMKRKRDFYIQMPQKPRLLYIYMYQAINIWLNIYKINIYPQMKYGTYVLIIVCIQIKKTKH